MSWKKVKLGDIADFSNGINFGKDAYSKGIKLIGVSDFGDSFFPDYDVLEEVKTDVVRKNNLLEDGDVVFVRSNGNKELVGRCMLIKDAPVDVTYSGFCIRARFKSKYEQDPVFWTYHFKSKAFRRSMSGTAIGANIQNLSQGRLAVYEAEIPNIETQRKIANVLSKYDDLIENNQKQIKLLEEAAQRLYKEWFVDLRFPGYEACKIVDGVPEGWEKRFVGDMLKKIPKKEQIKASEYMKSGSIPVIDQSKNFVAGYTNNQAALIEENLPIIVFGDHTRVLKYISFPFAKGADGTQLVLTNNIKRMPQALLYCSLINIDLSNYHYARHFKYLKAEEILVPIEEIAEQFNTVIQPIYELVQKKRDQCMRIAEARDRMLPKLMSGEIEV